MTVEWTHEAERALDEATDFVFNLFGWEACDRLLSHAFHVAKLLENHPHLGPVEPLLADRLLMYRSIVVGHYNKIIYRILDNRIEIVDFWDTRREPKAQAEQVKE